MSHTEHSHTRSGRTGSLPSASFLVAVVCLLSVLGTGCVEHALREKNRKPDFSAIPAPTPPEAQDGSILRGGSPADTFLFLDRKARTIGDLVTVLVVENVSASGSAQTRLGKTSTIDATASSDLGVTEAMQGLARWFFRVVGVANPGVAVPAGNTVNMLQTNTATDFEGDGETARKGRFNAIVTCRVIAELPGHVFHVRGRRSLIVNHEKQVLTVEGLVRREDIGINNTVLSTALAEAELGFDGMGVIDEKQRPPIVARIMDWIYPF